MKKSSRNKAKEQLIGNFSTKQNLRTTIDPIDDDIRRQFL